MELQPLRVLGADPGPATGVVLLRYPGRPSCYQCHGTDAAGLVTWLLASCAGPGVLVMLAGEAFQEGRGPGARTGYGTVTRQVIRELQAVAVELGIPEYWRAAGLVKPWATDKRLEKAGLLCPRMPPGTPCIPRYMTPACRTRCHEKTQENDRAV